MEIVGDSMSWVGIDEGDLAICRINPQPRSGDIVAVALEDADWGATIKYYVEEKGRRYLKAANPLYEDIPLFEGCYRIAGVAVQFYKQPPPLFVYDRNLNLREKWADYWQSVIAKAESQGLTPEKVESMIVLFTDMIKAWGKER